MYSFSYMFHIVSNIFKTQLFSRHMTIYNQFDVIFV